MTLEETTTPSSEPDAVHRAQEPSPRFVLSGDLVAAVTHDLRQPLTAIEMNVSAAMQLLRRPDAAIDDALDALDGALDQEHRMRDAVQVLQDLATRREPRREACDLSAAVRDTVTLVASDALARHVALQLDDEPALPPVSGDGLFIRQALLNVLVAGLGTIPPDAAAPSVVRILIRRAGSDAEVSVTCPGAFGVPGDLAEWELSLARSVVAIHAGTMNLRPLPGGGTIVTTTWPLHAA
jgi:C4-dicarboxylate-specific signal transduction histidine kinase